MFYKVCRPDLILMIKYSILFSMLFSMLVACGGNDAGSGSYNSEYMTLHVDANFGNDITGDGSLDKPYQTITKAMSESISDYTIYVEPGTYDAALGEVFPIVLKENVTLHGNPDNKGNGVESIYINGEGLYFSPTIGSSVTATIICGNNTKFKGFKVTSPAGAAMFCESANNNTNLTDNTISDSQTGILLAESADVLIKGNNISNNSYAGIEMLTTSMPKVRYNNISSNLVGVIMRNNSLPDLGTLEDSGANLISSNIDCDIENNTSNSIYAYGNHWDDNQFAFTAGSSCVGGENIANTGGGAVFYQEVPVSENPLFLNSEKIIINSPLKGALVSTTTPSFSWMSSGKSLVFAGLFNEDIDTKGNEISNTDNMIWAWHIGLGQGTEGDITFKDGCNVSSGVLLCGGVPTPLERGRTYYWAVWAWDDEGVKIVSSSEVYFFGISN